MTERELLIDSLREAHREFAIALDNFPEGDLWKRPHPKLLSVGELSAHVAYALAVWFLGDGDFRPDLATLPVQSPLLHPSVSYYPHTIESPFALDMTAEQVLADVTRIYEASIAALAEKDMEGEHPYWRTWRYLVQYQVFHIAYHTGQMYSVRHTLGHETEDN